MKVLELFSGTRSIGKAFEARGHEVFSIDFDRRFLANAHCDIETLTTEQILEWFGKPDVIWASPDCATFSMAAISHHREKDPATGALLPKTEYAAKCDRTDAHVMELIRDLDPPLLVHREPEGGGCARCRGCKTSPVTRSPTASTGTSARSPRTSGQIIQTRNSSRRASPVPHAMSQPRAALARERRASRPALIGRASRTSSASISPTSASTDATAPAMCGGFRR